MLSDLLINCFPLPVSGLPRPPNIEHKLEDLLCWNSPLRKADTLSVAGDCTPALDLTFELTEPWLMDEAPEFDRDLVMSAAAKASQADCTRSRCISFSSCLKLVNYCFIWLSQSNWQRKKRTSLTTTKTRSQTVFNFKLITQLWSKMTLTTKHKINWIYRTNERLYSCNF